MPTVTDWSLWEGPPPSELRLDHFLSHRAVLSPEAVAYEDGEKFLTYGDLDGLANGVAHRLAALGRGPSMVVGVLLERGLAMPVAVMGALKAGAAVYHLHPEEPQARLEALSARLRLAAVLTDARFSTLASTLGEPLLIDLASARREANPPPSTADGASLAQILPTSGSTGAPKLVLRSHGMLAGQMLYEQAAFRLSADDRHLFKFQVSFRESLLPALAGGRAVVARPGGHGDSRYLADLIRSASLTVASFVPTALGDLLRCATREDLASLRHVSCGGELFTNQLRRRFHAKCDGQLHSTFTMTEADYVSTWDSRPDEERPNGWLGHPTNMRLYVVDDDLRPVASQEVGEILVGGPGLAQGYLDDREATERKFIPDPFCPGEMVYRTGDLARLLADGTLAYAGRGDDQVKIGGQRIDLGEVDSALLSVEGVADAATVAWNPTQGVPRLVAHLVLDRPGDFKPQAIREQLAASLPTHMLPSHFVCADALPRLASGKLDRRALPAPPRERPAHAQTPLPAVSATEQIIAGVWGEVLWLEPVSRVDNFFEVGGTSLLAMEVQARLGALGIDISTADLLAHGSIARMAAWLDGKRSGLDTTPAVQNLRPDRAGATAALRARRRGLGQ